MSERKKWHINNNGEVGECSAKISCRFGGDSGMDNHFFDKREAVKNSNRILAERFGELAETKSKSKDRVSTDEREVLIEYGMKETGKKASTKNEVIEKGFKNNPEAYERLKSIADSDESSRIGKSAKIGIGKMVSKGIHVKASSNLRETFNSTDDLMNDSNVDVLRETAGEKPTLNDLVNDYGIPTFGRKR